MNNIMLTIAEPKFLYIPISITLCDRLLDFTGFLCSFLWVLDQDSQDFGSSPFGFEVKTFSWECCTLMMFKESWICLFKGVM